MVHMHTYATFMFCICLHMCFTYANICQTYVSIYAYYMLRYVSYMFHICHKILFLFDNILRHMLNINATCEPHM